jgi:hypothetical protein
MKIPNYKALIVLLLGTMPHSGYAELPHTISFQGYLVNDASEPIEGSTDISFSIPGTGWHEQHFGVPLKQGVFSVQLGSETSLEDVDFSQPHSLQIDVNDISQTVELSSVPYALHAKTVEYDSDTLKELTCASGQVAKSTGSSWVCGDLSGGGSSAPVSGPITGSSKPITGQSIELEIADGSVQSGKMTGMEIGISTSGAAVINKETVVGLDVDISKAQGTATKKAAIFQGGNVGIGTPNPSAKLEVVGKVKANNIGSVFIRWGNATAPEGTTLLYSGFGFGGRHMHSGGGANPICMKAGDPGAPGPGSQYGDVLHPLGTGDATRMPPGIPAKTEIKCAVSYVEGPSFEMWGSDTCPAGWRAAYTGYGMGSYYNHGLPSNRHCVDNKEFDSSVANTYWGDTWYGTVLHSNTDVGIYETNRYVKCALCVKDQ